MAVPVHIGSYIGGKIERKHFIEFYWMNTRYKAMYSQTVYRLPMRCVYHFICLLNATLCVVAIVCWMCLCSPCVSLTFDSRQSNGCSTDVMDGDARNKCHGNADYSKHVFSQCTLKFNVKLSLLKIGEERKNKETREIFFPLFFP